MTFIPELSTHSKVSDLKIMKQPNLTWCSNF